MDKLPKITERPFVPSVGDSENWSGLFNYNAQDKRITFSKGFVYGAMSINGPASFPSHLAGKYIWDAVVDKYYFNSKGKILRCLHDAVKAGRYKLISMLKNNDQFADKGVDLSLVVAVVWHDFLYVGIIGEPVVYLLRDKRAIDIGGAFNDPNSTKTVHVGSGRLEQGDLLLLGSPKTIDRMDVFFDYIRNQGKRFDLKGITEWFKKESVLFDADESFYVLGLDVIQEDESEDVESKVEETSDRSLEIKEEVGVTQEEAKEDLKVATEIEEEEKVEEEPEDLLSKKSKLEELKSNFLGFFSKKAAEQASKGSLPRVPEGKESDVAIPIVQKEIKPEKMADDKLEAPEADVLDKPLDHKDNKKEARKEQEDTLSKLSSKGSKDLSFHERRALGLIDDTPAETRETPQEEHVSREKPGEAPESGLASVSRKQSVVSKAYDKLTEGLKKQVPDLWRKVMAFISTFRQGEVPQKVFVGKKTDSLPKKIFIGLIILLVGFLIVKRIIDAREEAAVKADYESQILALDEEFVSIQDEIVVDPEGSRQRLIDLAEKAQTVAKIDYDENKASERYEEIYTKVYEIEKKVILSEEDGNFSVVLDAYEKFGDGVEITDIAISEDVLYLVDKAGASVHTYNLSTDARGKVLDPDEALSKPKLVEVGSSGSIYVYDEEQGVLKYSEESGKFKVLSGLTPRLLGNVTEFAVYGDSDNLYFLDNERARVFKSEVSGAGYSAPSEYISFGGFDKASDIAIDGNIFVASRASERVYKFFRGVKDSFIVKGLYEPLGVPSGIFIAPGFTNLYVTDLDNHRLVVLETPDTDRHKGEAVLVKQYVYKGSRENVFDSFTEVVAIMSGGDASAVYILEDNMIFRVTL